MLCEAGVSYGHGVSYEISAKAYIVDNYFENIGLNSDLCPIYDSNPIWLSGSNNCEIWNNTIVGSEQHIKITQDKRVPDTSLPNPLYYYGIDYDRPMAFYNGSDPSYPYNGEMTWTITNVVIKNNLCYKLAGLSGIQSNFFTIYDDSDGVARLKRDTVVYGIHTTGNVYNRLDATTSPRFANGSRSDGGIEIYSTMTASAHSYPIGTNGPSWKIMTGETGSVFIDGSDATITSAYPYTLTPATTEATTPEPLPAAIAAICGRQTGDIHIGAWL